MVTAQSDALSDMDSDHVVTKLNPMIVLDYYTTKPEIDLLYLATGILTHIYAMGQEGIDCHGSS